MTKHTQRALLRQHWQYLQRELIPEVKQEVGGLTPTLEKLIHLLEWIKIDDVIGSTWQGVGRIPHDRGALACAFVAKAVLGLSTTTALIERLSVDKPLRRICGFSLWKKLPTEATFSRAFADVAKKQLVERVHERLVKDHLGDSLIGHISRDGTAIEVREKPARKTPAAPSEKKPRGRPKKGEVRDAPASPIERQLTQRLHDILAELPTPCDRGSKCNAQGYVENWNGYKLHMDTADGGVPISALLSSASMHDSLAAVPLSRLTADRVTNLYDLMDAAYCCDALRKHSRTLGHVPLIDHNPRRGEKKPFAPHEAQRYKERTTAERTNARLKDEFGGRHLRVRGALKVMAHLMFGLVVLTADQLMRLLL